MSALKIENETLKMDFDPSNGALISLIAKESNWEILNRAHLGLCFQLLVPLPGRRNNSVFGESQKTSSAEVDSNNKKIRFVWDGVDSQYGGRLNIRLTQDVQLTNRQAIFSLSIDNQTDFTIENVFFPFLGDINPPPDRPWFKTLLWNIWGVDEWSLWPTYDNLRGYYGINSPTQLAPVPLPRSGGDFLDPIPPFILLRGADRGLYVGLNAPSTELVTWFTELRPGFTSHMTGHVPNRPRIGHKDVATRFAAVHVPYILPGESRNLTPVVIEAYQGSWHTGAEIYRSWRNTWMQPAKTPEWTKEPHAWFEFCMNSPEDELRLPYKDLNQIGQECVRHGIKAIQLNGWNTGGQDGGYPYLDPDPALGTKDELKQAIKDIQGLGVKVILFTKFIWADRSTKEFRENLIRLAAKDPYGDYYVHPGYPHQTITQLLGINQRRMVPMCFSSDEYLKLCEDIFRQILDLGADGILIDECLHHTPALLCFDTSHGHRYGIPISTNDRELINEFSKMIPPENQDFLFVGEAPYDWEFEAYPMGYIRTALTKHVPIMRYLQPDVPLMAAVPGFDDRHLINQCLMYRYIISYEPYNFKGRLDDFPLTLDYGKKMDALRSELREYFWDGLFNHERGAKVTSGGQLHHPYSVFTNRKNGKIGVVVANYSEAETIVVNVVLDDGSTLNRYRLVDDPEWKPTARGVEVPPRSAAVVIE